MLGGMKARNPACGLKGAGRTRKLDSLSWWGCTSGAAGASTVHEVSHGGGILPPGTTQVRLLRAAPGGGGPPLRAPMTHDP
jgi:hypothetical protein